MDLRDADYICRPAYPRLGAHREARGLSQDDLADRMTERGFGFSHATIWKIEQGKRPVKISEVTRSPTHWSCSAGPPWSTIRPRRAHTPIFGVGPIELYNRFRIITPGW